LSISELVALIPSIARDYQSKYLALQGGVLFEIIIDRIILLGIIYLNLILKKGG
jgi:hypothetical protein